MTESNIKTRSSNQNAEQRIETAQYPLNSEELPDFQEEAFEVLQEGFNSLDLTDPKTLIHAPDLGQFIMAAENYFRLLHRQESDKSVIGMSCVSMCIAFLSAIESSMVIGPAEVLLVFISLTGFSTYLSQSRSDRLRKNKELKDSEIDLTVAINKLLNFPTIVRLDDSLRDLTHSVLQASRNARRIYRDHLKDIEKNIEHQQLQLEKDQEVEERLMRLSGGKKTNTPISIDELLNFQQPDHNRQ